MKKYNQLNLGQRYQIESLLGLGYSQTEIARQIGCHRSTISRELQRNIGKRGIGSGVYRAELSHTKSQNREKVKRKHKRLTEKMLRYIRKQLRSQKWSPEFISQKGKEKYGDFVSHETIYKYLWLAKKSNSQKYIEDKSLHKELKHSKRYCKRSKTKQNRGMIPNRTPMAKRPTIVNKRNRIGDLEVDLMMGTKHRPGLIVITDRTTIETDLIKISTKKAEVIARKIIERLSLKNHMIYTLTFDNDLAFAQHETIAKALNVATYFTRPYTSQDKGTVENRIGVIRRFFPKGTDMKNVHWNTIRSVETKLNNRPVRKFNYLSPKEKKLLLNNVALVS